MALVMIFLFGITASTFAWFKINSNASVSGFEFTVQGGEGYQISLDDVNYSNSLTSKQMTQAILAGYDNNYTVYGDNIYYGATIENKELVGGTLIPEYTVIERVSKIELMPVTPHVLTTGAFSFRNYSGSTIQPNSGQYVEFSIYFRGLGKQEDNQSYGVYVLGENYYDAVTGESAPKTSIKSKEKNEITLKANMTAIDNSTLSTIPKEFADRTTKTYNTGDKIDVYTSNAIRFSIGNEYDENHKADTDYVCSNQIYEISDDQYYDLGSYATDYDTYIADTTRNTSGAVQTALEHNLYDCDSNAQYTYYNNLRSYSLQTPLKYEDMPKTIRHLTTVSENNNENSEYYNTLKYFTVVNSGEQSHKLTFRFWLEGWDADCFEGISKAIRVNLSFGSVKLS